MKVSHNAILLSMLTSMSYGVRRTSGSNNSMILDLGGGREGLVVKAINITTDVSIQPVTRSSD